MYREAADMVVGSKRLPFKSNCPGCDGGQMHRTWSLDHFECECRSPWDDRVGCGCTWTEKSHADSFVDVQQAERDAAIEAGTLVLYAKQQRTARLERYRAASGGTLVLGAIVTIASTPSVAIVVATLTTIGQAVLWGQYFLTGEKK